MSSDFLIRKALESDVEQIYRICCDVQLCKGIPDINRRGFLLSDFRSNPEYYMRIFSENVLKDYAYSYEHEGRVVGFLIAYSLKNWKKVKGDLLIGNHINNWNYNELERLGINEISDLSSIVVRDKTAVSPSFIGNNIGPMLVKHLSQELHEQGVEYQIAGIVEKAYKDDVKLDFNNMASANFQKRIGSVRVGESNQYVREDTCLGQGVKFVDGIYIVRTRDVLANVG